MKKITIKEIRLLNFKGVRDLSVKFDDRVTEISGTNGVGKSTVFDAFCWVMFGKNAADKKDFSIKTTNLEGVPIPRLPHEVTAVLQAGEETVTLRRCYSEKWTKKRGEAVECFSGHTEERYYNDVPCSASEYDAKVNALCPESVFKFITNPGYFPTRKEDQMRQLLFEMAGTVPDEKIAEGNADFVNLLQTLSGKTMEEYKKEIQAKKRRIQADIETIPGRIDERKRDLLDPEATGPSERELESLQKELEAVEAQIADKSKAYEHASEERMELVKRQQTLKEQRMKLESDIRMNAQRGYRMAIADKRKTEMDIASIKYEMTKVNTKLADQQSALEQSEGERAKLLEEWKHINAEIKSGLVPDGMMDEKQFVCPTCGRRYEVDEIEARQKEITERYIAGKISEKDANQAKGIALKKKMQGIQEEIDRLTAVNAKKQAEVDRLSAEPCLKVAMEEPSGDAEVAADKDLKKLDEQIAAMQPAIDAPVEAPDTTALTEQKKDLQKRIAELQDFISKNNRMMEDNVRNLDRIEELEKELRAANEEKARLEGIEFNIVAFSKARTRAIEDNINSMFSLVRFKLFDTQINGAEVECCVPMVDGVPYADANTAGKVNAGLDIINTIICKRQLSAPIFIDGSESIVKFVPVDSQVIKLTVTHEPTLTVRTGQSA